MQTKDIYKSLLALAAVATIGTFAINFFQKPTQPDNPSTDTSNSTFSLENLNQFLNIEIYNTYHLIVLIIIFVFLFIILHKRYQDGREEDNRIASIEFHKLLHAFREYMHQIVNECEKIVDEITHATNHDEIEASKSKMNAFNIELAKKINKASRQTANTVQQCVQKNFKNRKIVENCSAGILITNLQNHYDKFASNYKDTKYQWNDMDVCPIALDKKTYDDVIYEWKKIHSKDLKSFKIADSTPIQEVMGKRARFVKNDLVNYLNPSSPSTNTIPLESIECICKANAVLIIPIHSVDVKNHSYFPFGFISVFSENKSKKSLFNNNRDTEIYNQLSLCSDSLSSLFMLSLIVTKKVNLAYRLKKDLINSHDQINNQET